MSATRIETLHGTAKDVRVYSVDGVLCLHDPYSRHTLTLSPDEAEALSKALAAGAATLRDQPKGKR